MKTRSWNLHQDHVMSLNLIQLEFYKHEAIQTAYRSYREHLAFPAPTDPSQNRTFDDERQDRFYTLVKEIADVLDFTFDKADLRRLSYTPQGWHDDLSKQNYLRALFIEALEGRRPIPVSQFHMNVVNNKFPEPPAGVVKANDL
jgi:hypothetical protein